MDKAEIAMNMSLQEYLANKKVYPYRGKPYYKLYDYKESYYINADIIKRLEEGPQEVELERNSQYSAKNPRGMVKWDPVRQQILLSQSKVRLYYKPFKID